MVKTKAKMLTTVYLIYDKPMYWTVLALNLR